ncbi:MAG: hypothetical protein WB780_02825 [Candidatus Acidiferrales bacterium]
MNWLSAHYQWVIGVVLVPIVLIFIKHWLDSSRKTATNAVTQSPVITVSPTFNLPQLVIAPENPQKKSPATAVPRSADRVETNRPELYSLKPRICFVTDEDDGFTEGGNVVRAVLATFRMRKPSSDRRGTNIAARLSYQTTSNIGTRQSWTEFGRVNHGNWLDEDFNSVGFTLTNTKELILAMELEQTLVAVQDNRHSVSKRKEPSYFALEATKFFVLVTLVDEISGPLITYTYEIRTNPLTVAEIIRVI